MKKTIYITGAAGFIGRNTARHFDKNGWYVIGMGLGQWDGEEFREWGIQEWYPGMITQELLLNVRKKPDVIVHCAGSGSVGFSVENPKDDFDMTVTSTLIILEFIRLHSPDTRLIYPSSAAVYGQKEDMPIKENDPLEPISPYGFHKKICEELCESYSKNYDIKVSIARLFSVYGAGLQKQLLWDACRKIHSHEEDVRLFGTGLEKRDWIHVSDVAEIFRIFAASKNTFEIVNGGTGFGVTIKDVIAKILEAAGKNKNIIFNNVSKEGDPVFYTADTDRVEKIGWNQRISLNDGIDEYVANFQKNQRND